MALAVATGVATAAVAPGQAAPARPRTPAFPTLRPPFLSLLIVSGELQAGDVGEVAIRISHAARCSLTLDGPRRTRSGPYVARLHVHYGRWRWRVPRDVRGGAWLAVVRCRRGRSVRSRRSRIYVAATRRNRSSLVARHSMRLSTNRRSPGPLGGPLSRKGGGSYPGDDAICRWNLRHNGACHDDEWGYLRPNGTWSLISSRGFNYRNCTDYVAWFMGLTWSSFGFRPGAGDAADWKRYAPHAGLQVRSSPTVGDIAWWGRRTASGFGHVAVVTAVEPSGLVAISEYNGDGHGAWDVRTGMRADAYLHRAPEAPLPLPQLPPTQTTPTTPTTPTTTTPTTTTPQPPQPPQPQTWSEQEGHLGVDTFLDPDNASGKGPRIGAAAWVLVSCKRYAPHIQSVNPDGYWYRIASAPWSNAYYSPANTFMNGDPWNGPFTHNTDFAVSDC